jgi:hypothetical protein
MASIIPGYEYDIFISYLHNDNRSGWVTQLIGNTAGLMESIRISLYQSTES